MSERLYVLDAPGYVYRAYHALPYLSTSRGVPSHVVLGMSTMVWKLLREERPEYFAAAWDPPGPTFRDQRFTAYKATRAAMPDDLRVQIPYVRRLIEALRLPLLEVPGFEADDAIATLVDRVRERPIDIVLVTADKDLFQLVGPRVRVLTTAGRGGERLVLDEAAVREKWGVSPEQIADVLALMGDSIDNIPGVPGVGEKTAVKLVSQFGSVERLYENLHLVPGKLRETLAANRAKALLSRELATLNTEVPIEADLEKLRRRDPDWDVLRHLWSELEFGSLLRQLPTPSAAEVAAEAAPVLEGSRALAGYLAKVPPDAPLAVEWVGESGPPDPAPTVLGLYHPDVGAVQLRTGDALPDLGGRPLVGHDAKHLVECWLARGAEPPPIEDTAIAAYLLNPARTNYRLEEVCAELLGQGPGLIPAGSRGRFVWDLWAMAPEALRKVGLLGLYEDVERPLIRVLAGMERQGIRVDPERLAEFSRELDLSLDRITREIYALADGEFNIGSPKQLGTVLFEKLKLPPVKKTKTGYSTDADVLEQLALGHELPAKIIEHRTLSKLKSTYADALPTLIDARTGRIHTSFNQLVAVTGRLSCLPAGARIDTDRGLIGIEAVKPGDLVRTSRGPRRVLATQMTGVRPVMALRLSTGVIFRCSPEHKLRSLGEWREAASLRAGDALYMSFRPGLFGANVRFTVVPTAAYRTRKTPRLPTEWTLELAELVGYAMADGHLACSNYNRKPAKLILAFGWDDGELVEHFAGAIRRLFGKEATYRVTRTCQVLEGSGVDICGMFEQLGAAGYSNVIQVPASLSSAPEDVVAAFLRGYFEGDGSASNGVHVRSMSRDMLEGIYHLLTLFGIPSKIRDDSPDPRGYAPRHTLIVLGDRSKRIFEKRIGFLSSRKRAQLRSFLSQDLLTSTSESLTLSKPHDVLRFKSAVYASHRNREGQVPAARHVFMHKVAARRSACTLPRAERIVSTLEPNEVDDTSFLAEAVAGQYCEVTIEAIAIEPNVPMYDMAVDGEEYIADGIVVHNSSAPNLQNIPIRTELGRRIRAAFVPEAGRRFLAADYSQIELRILAHACGEESLVEAFRRGEDIHRRTAAEVFGVAIDQVTAAQRDVAKTTNFSVIYGVTAFGLSRGLSITPKEAQQYLDQFFARHPKVKAHLERTVAEGRERGYVTTLLGRRRYLPELRSGNPNLRSFGERMATNAPIQGTAADLIKIAMVRMAKELATRGLESRMLLQVHDELLFEAPEGEIAELEALAVEVMESALPLSVPLKVDVKAGLDWAEA